MVDALTTKSITFTYRQRMNYCAMMLWSGLKPIERKQRNKNRKANVKDAYRYYTSTQEPNRNRVGGNTTLYREFYFGGVTFREIRDTVDGQRFIPANECYFVPTGTQDTFVSYVAPSAKLSMANTLGENQYLWVYDDAKGYNKEIELEFSHVHLLRRPSVVVKATKA